MSRTALTRSLLILVMSCAIACYSGMALHATAPVVPQDTTTLVADTLGTKEPSKLVTTPPTDAPNLADKGKAESKALQGTTAMKGDKRPGELPFIKKMTRWFTRYPNSNVALLCSIIPGGGQLYNQRYWKIPIALSAMTAGLYAVTWNQRLYNEYHTAYADLLSENPLDHASWQAFIPPGADPSKYVSDGNLRSRLERGSKQYKESRDLSIVLTVALYLLSALDAYVDAELYYFNVSPQLTVDMGEGLRDKPSGPRPQSVMVGASVRF